MMRAMNITVWIGCLTLTQVVFAGPPGRHGCPGQSRPLLVCTPNPQNDDQAIAIGVFKGTTTVLCGFRGNRTLYITDGKQHLVEGEPKIQSLTGATSYTVESPKLDVELTYKLLAPRYKDVNGTLAIKFPGSPAHPSVTMSCVSKVR